MVIPMGKVVDKGSVPRRGDYSFRGAVFQYVTKRAERWAKAADLYVSGIFNYGFAHDTIPVADLDTNYAAKGSVRLAGKAYRESAMICPGAAPRAAAPTSTTTWPGCRSGSSGCGRWSALTRR